MPRVSLRQGLDRDVYQLVRKFEDEHEQEGSRPRLSVTAIYEYIRNSNSSLGRLKRKPLEESIERAVNFRKQDLRDQEDSEGEPEQPSEKESKGKEAPKPASDLLNRQLARRWKLAERKEQSNDEGSRESPKKMSGTKKRRLSRSPSATDATRATANGDRAGTESQQAKPATPKRPKASKGYHVVDTPNTPPLGGISQMVEEFEKRLWYPMVKYAGDDEVMDCDTDKVRMRPLLLSGPIGCGKSTLLRHLASRWKVPYIQVDCEVLAISDRAEKSLADVYEEAIAMAPCVVELKSLDFLFQSHGSAQPQTGAPVAFVKDFMKRIAASQIPKRPIAIAATTRHPETIPAGFYMIGLIQNIYTLKAPNPEARLEILQALAETWDCQGLDFTPIAQLTHGYLPVDLAVIFQNSEFEATFAGRPMTISDLEDAAKDHVPHLRREGFSQVPEVTLDQVGGLRSVIELLEANIIDRIRFPEYYKSVKKFAGVLLWGPPGCGKTLVAQAIANAAKASFILVNGPELLDKYVGESERKIRALFTRARASTPCLIFLDEIDSLVPRRDTSSTEAGARVVNTILTELDGAQGRSGVYVIAATNRPDMIDPAMFRTGRFNHKVFVDVPNEEERVDILRTLFRTRDIICDAAVAEEVARDPRCVNFSGADLSELSDRAVMVGLKRTLADRKAGKEVSEETRLTKEHWETALSQLKPSVRNLEMYHALAKADEMGTA